MNPAPLSLADAAAGDPSDLVLTSLLSRLNHLLSLPHASFVLLTAPPGAGKTTLATRAAYLTARPLLPLNLSLLISPSAGDAEAFLDAFFARAAAAAPAVVLLDNLDAAAPAEPAGPADARALAGLCAALDDLGLDPGGCEGLVLLGTACYPREVHPALRRAGRFAEEVRLEAPGWARRRALLAAAVGVAGVHGEGDRDGEGLEECGQVLDEVARLSPGFLPADLVTLVSTAEMAAARNGGGDAAPASPTERTLLLLLHMRAAVHSVRPTLLTGAGTSWSPIEWRDDGGAGGMFGVASQVDALASCVRAMFRGGADSERVEGRKRSPRRVLDALGAVAGVVLYGPPGSGKTSLACAATSFLPRGAVNGFVLNSAEVVGAVVGAAEQKLRALFALARATAPAVLVLENIEVLAPSRRVCEEEGAEVGSSSAAAFQRLLSTFLVELDGIAKGEGSGGGIVLLVATTSDIGRIDSALLRPGRLEVHIEMEYPDEDARVEILSTHLSRVAPHLCESSWLRSFAQATHGRSAADLQGVCTEAVMLKLRESNMTCSNGGTIEPLCLEHRHLLRALSATSWTP